MKPERAHAQGHRIELGARDAYRPDLLERGAERREIVEEIVVARIDRLTLLACVAGQPREHQPDHRSEWLLRIPAQDHVSP
jgi:hypothetical protein